MKIFVLGLPHTQSNLNFTSCAFTMKVINLCKMLHRRGHEVYHLGTEGSEVECTENITVTPESMWKEFYGNPGTKFYHFESKGKYQPYSDLYVKNTRREILKRLNKDYEAIICMPWGGLQNLATQGLRQYIVESGIGYPELQGAPYKVFESYAWWNFHLGKRNMAGGACWYETVIPNSFDPDLFTFKEQKEDYYLYFGRLIDPKGVSIALQVTKNIGAKLIICGQGDPAPYLKHEHVQYIPPVGVETRRELLANAKAMFVPTIYIEPFGGVSIEGLLSGTPVITSDFGVFSETIPHGHVGYRCRSFEEFVWAAKNIGNINPNVCRDWALNNFSIDRISRMYEEFFQQIFNIQDKGWYQEHDKRRDLNCLKLVYPTSSPIVFEKEHNPPKLISKWFKAQVFENNWWTSVENEKWDNEIKKQKVYAKHMEINYNSTEFENKSVLDIGGGPVSMLFNVKFKEATVIDPLTVSEKIKNKYKISGINFLNIKAEDMDLDENYDECWIYNCLMHTESPGKIMSNIKKCCSTIRLFEWINQGGDQGHPNILTEEWFEILFDTKEWEKVCWNSGFHRYTGGTNSDEYLALILKKI